MTLLSTMLTMVAIFIMIVNPTKAAPTRGMRAESSEIESRDVPAVANVIDEIFSLIGDASFLNGDDVAKFIADLSAPTHDKRHGCVQAKDDADLSVRIGNAGDGQVRLCPGKIHFNNEIVLTESITISCAGPMGSCILDGNEDTRHFVSNVGGLTLAFTDLTFINGFTDVGSGGRAEGGSVFLSGSTTIFDGCVFKNNRALSSSSSVRGGAIYATSGETVVNNCLFLDNSGVTTKAGDRISAIGGAIASSNSSLKVFGSIFKENKALQVTPGRGGGGAIYAFGGNVNTNNLVLSSVFELNEATNKGGAALFSGTALNADWYNNKDLSGNDAGVDCDGVADNKNGGICVNVGDNFSI